MLPRIQFLIILILFSVSIALGQAQITIAILYLESQGVSESEALILTERIRTELFQTGKYIVLERSNMQDILKEQGFQQSGCTGDECVVIAGRMLGLQQMVAGAVSKFGRIYTITLRLIDVESGKILAMSFVDSEGSIEDVLLQSTKEAVRKLAGETTQPEIRSTADIYITSEPAGAEIFIDGEELEGTTPSIFEGLQPGEYEVRLIKGNFVGKQTVILDPGEIKRVDIKLEQMTGNLKIISNPFEAEVWINGSLKGKTPLLISNVDAGLVKLTLKKDGYQNLLRSVMVEPDKVNRYNFTLNPVPVEKEQPRAEIPPILPEFKEKRSKTWLYVAGAAVIAGGAAYYYLSQQEKQGTLIIKVPVNP